MKGHAEDLWDNHRECTLVGLRSPCERRLTKDQKNSLLTKLSVRSFGVIGSEIQSPGSQCIKGTDESILVTYSSVSLMNYDPCDLGSPILIQVIPKARAPRGLLGSIFAGYVPLASRNPYPIIVYSVAKL